MTSTTADAFKLFMDGAEALSIVESNGIRIDTEYLDQAILKLGKKIQRLETEIRQDDVYSLWRRRYSQSSNLGSRPQLASVLFDDMGLKYKWDKTGSNRYRTDDEVLRSLNHPFVNKWMKTEGLKRFLATHLKGIQSEVIDGFLHTFFNLHTVTSFRGSSSDPNFQNIPIRDPVLGKIIRRSFIARKGRLLVEVDYGALEFRGASAIWKDPAMIDYCLDEKKDIHRDQAARSYLLKRNQVSKDTRYCGKNGFVFPRLYGSYYAPIAQNMWNMIKEKKLKVFTPNGDGASLFDHLKEEGITELGECDPRIDPKPETFEYHIRQEEHKWDKRFPTLKESQERFIADYRKRGWFDLPTGFRCHGLYSKNQLLNIPVQGSCFHCLLLSLILLQKWLRKHKMKSLIVGQIHDSVQLDVPPNELQDVLTSIQNIMTQEIPKRWDWVIVPLLVEVDISDIGTTWHHKKPWKNEGGTWKAKGSK